MALVIERYARETGTTGSMCEGCYTCEDLGGGKRSPRSRLECQAAAQANGVGLRDANVMGRPAGCHATRDDMRYRYHWNAFKVTKDRDDTDYLVCAIPPAPPPTPAPKAPSFCYAGRGKCNTVGAPGNAASMAAVPYAYVGFAGLGAAPVTTTAVCEVRQKAVYVAHFSDTGGCGSFR